ncbi:MAG: DUF1828 domain-containing protein [Candidatus Halichondribacter symbioticus]
MNINTEHLIDGYYKWLKDKTVWKNIEDFVEITTPYLDRHNDYIQIYLKQDGDGYILTDDSYTIEDLEMSGCAIESPKRQKLLEVTLNGFGIKTNNKELFVKATKENFAVSKHNFVQAVLAVNDMFYLARSTVTNVFVEEVQVWLRKSEVRFNERVFFGGKSGYNSRFDFAIPPFKDNPERIIQTINNPTDEQARQLAWKWQDARDLRPHGAKAYAVINNGKTSVKPSITDALNNYEITPIPYSNRNDFVRQLAA